MNMRGHLLKSSHSYEPSKALGIRSRTDNCSFVRQVGGDKSGPVCPGDGRKVRVLTVLSGATLKRSQPLSVPSVVPAEDFPSHMCVFLCVDGVS